MNEVTLIYLEGFRDDLTELVKKACEAKKVKLKLLNYRDVHTYHDLHSLNLSGFPTVRVGDKELSTNFTKEEVWQLIRS